MVSVRVWPGRADGRGHLHDCRAGRRPGGAARKLSQHGSRDGAHRRVPQRVDGGTAMNPLSRRTSRRTVLRGAAGAAIALPWLEAFAPRHARAAAVAPKRFIAMFSPNGTLPGQWTPTGGETDFALSPILAPLEPHRADIVVVQGLNQQGGGGDGHQSGIGGMLTGRPLNGGPFAGVGAPPAGWAAGPSVDQRIAEAWAVPTKFRSLELGVQVGTADDFGRMIYRAANQPLPPTDDPAEVYAGVFTDLHTDAAVLA